MDGVIANFKKDAERLGNPHRPDKYVHTVQTSKQPRPKQLHKCSQKTLKHKHTCQDIPNML